MLAEPSARDSMAAIGLAAALLERRDPDAVMGSFAADHVITETAVFHAAVATAVEAARAGWLVTIGIEPTYPATGFGYISAGDALAGGARRRSPCASSSRSPTPRSRRRTSRTGYRWNAGMFVVRPTVLLDLLAEHDPGFAAALRGDRGRPVHAGDVWPTPAEDRGRPRRRRARCRRRPGRRGAGRFGWDDIGDFASLRLAAARRRRRRSSCSATRDLVRTIDARGLVVPAGGRMVAVVGLRTSWWSTPATRCSSPRCARAQDVKSIVAALKEDGHVGLT